MDLVHVRPCEPFSRLSRKPLETYHGYSAGARVRMASAHNIHQALVQSRLMTVSTWRGSPCCSTSEKTGGGLALDLADLFDLYNRFLPRPRPVVSFVTAVIESTHFRCQVEPPDIVVEGVAIRAPKHPEAMT